MIISHSLKYVFFAIPKTASKSVSELLINQYQGEYHGNYHNVVIPENCLSYYKFCTVRHPYTRAVSFYYHILHHKRHRCHELVKRLSFEQWLVWLTNFDMLPMYFCCEDDVKNHKTSCDLEHEFFARSVTTRRGRDLNQTDYLAYALALNYIPKVDLIIIRQEQLEDGFRRLPFVENGHVKLPRLNVTPNKVDWRTLLTPRTEALIYEWSKEDFENFGYERETFDENSSALASKSGQSGSDQGVVGSVGG